MEGYQRISLYGDMTGASDCMCNAQLPLEPTGTRPGWSWVLGNGRDSKREITPEQWYGILPGLLAGLLGQTNRLDPERKCSSNPCYCAPWNSERSWYCFREPGIRLAWERKQPDQGPELTSQPNFRVKEAGMKQCGIDLHTKEIRPVWLSVGWRMNAALDTTEGDDLWKLYKGYFTGFTPENLPLRTVLLWMCCLSERKSCLLETGWFMLW